MAKVIGNEGWDPREGPRGIAVDVRGLGGNPLASGYVPTSVRAVMAAALQSGSQSYLALTLATANIDQAAAAVAPTFAKYIWVHCSNAFRVAFGQTSATNGATVPGGTAMCFPIGSTGDNTVHAQSETSLSVLNLTYLSDL